MTTKYSFPPILHFLCFCCDIINGRNNVDFYEKKVNQQKPLRRRLGMHTVLPPSGDWGDPASCLPLPATAGCDDPVGALRNSRISI